jgi:hypothetical protein
MNAILRSCLMVCTFMFSTGLTYPGLVVHAAMPPIQIQPQGSVTNQVGSTLTLRVINDPGTGLRFQWRHNGINIADATNSVLIINDVGGQDSGTYRVLATLVDGSEAVLSSAVEVFVLLQATVVSEATFAEMIAGTNVIFSVDVRGPGPIDYSLTKDSTPLILSSNGQLQTFFPRIYAKFDANVDGNPEHFNIQFTIVQLQATDSGSYRISMHNPAGDSPTVEIATLSVLVPPAVTVRPQSQIIYVGDDFSLSVSVSGTQPLFCQWLKDAANVSSDFRITGSKGTTLTVRNATNTDEGIYQLAVSNKAGLVLSPSATVKIISGSTVSWVQYDIPLLYDPGLTNLIKITVTPPTGTKTYAIEDIPPSGWGASAKDYQISPPGPAASANYDANVGKVKIGTFNDDLARTLSYLITPPADSIDKVLLEVIGSADGSDTRNFKILFPNLPHPADTNGDFRVESSEVTSYAFYWLKGMSWNRPPTNVPASYVTRAGALWRGGAAYILDPSIPAPPLWWINQTATPRAGKLSIHEQNTAARSVTGANVTIFVQPASDAIVYAVQESIPSGFTSDAINEGGSVDQINHQIKWGPFFDNQARTFKYTLHPPQGFSGAATIAGIISVDGQDLDITGDSAFDTSPVIGEAQLVLEKFPGLIISGTIGNRYRIESAESITTPQWTVLDTITLTNNPQNWVDPREPFTKTQRFYRAVTAP